MADLTELIKSLAKATGLSEEMAEAVLGTAVDYVKTQRPEKADQVDAQLENAQVSEKASNLIADLSKKAKGKSDDS